MNCIIYILYIQYTMHILALIITVVLYFIFFICISKTSYIDYCETSVVSHGPVFFFSASERCGLTRLSLCSKFVRPSLKKKPHGVFNLSLLQPTKQRTSQKQVASSQGH